LRAHRPQKFGLRYSEPPQIPWASARSTSFTRRTSLRRSEVTYLHFPLQ
jgi:hypothetical protein